MADPTLGAIRTKIRRITRSPSINQITDAQIDEYVNTFIQYDFPEHLRLGRLLTTLTWYTQPFIDTYATTAVAGDPLNNFENINLTVHPPIYVAGFEAYFTQNRNQFFRMYPFANSIASIGVTGDGITKVFNGTLSPIPVLRSNVVFSAIDANNVGMRLSDDGVGNIVGDGNGAINYITGVYNINFNNPPAAGSAINSETVPYVAARPLAVLYFNNRFTVRPVPDQVYPINMEVYVRATDLGNVVGAIPELEEWWQYIAISASKKILEDRMDMESVQMIMPMLKEQEKLILRRTLVQQSNERVATIYTEVESLNNGWFPGGF